ncbi:hypothetical protein LUR56_31080 [Streptomyces sp. MT29]|nr:hypothetical protein [Streptomyces sp. MT29]
MAVTLTKTPQLHLFLATVTNTGTDTARVHHLLLTHDQGYDDQVSRMHDLTNATPGATLVASSPVTAPPHTPKHARAKTPATPCSPAGSSKSASPPGSNPPAPPATTAAVHLAPGPDTTGTGTGRTAPHVHALA